MSEGEQASQAHGCSPAQGQSSGHHGAIVQSLRSPSGKSSRRRGELPLACVGRTTAHTSPPSPAGLRLRAAGPSEGRRPCFRGNGGPASLPLAWTAVHSWVVRFPSSMSWKAFLILLWAPRRGFFPTLHCPQGFTYLKHGRGSRCPHPRGITVHRV